MSYTLGISPFLHALLGDDDVAQLFSAEAELASICEFELQLAKAQEKHGIIPKGAAKKIGRALEEALEDGSKIDEAIARDGLIIPGFIAKAKAALDPADSGFLHRDTTSQDAIDTAFMMRADMAFEIIGGHNKNIFARLDQLVKQFGSRPLMGRTRMQAALAITVADRLGTWQNILGSPANAVANLMFLLQLSGPVGVSNNADVKKTLAKALNLSYLATSWQTDRNPILEMGNACAGLTGALGKIGADIALMAQNEFAEIRLAGTGRSSAMPHKQNPVKAEVLVSLARFNAAMLSALHNAAVHEQERSGAAWTLEWLVLPQMIYATAGAARLAHELLTSIESIGT